MSKKTPKSFLWKGKIYSDLSKAPPELLEVLTARGWHEPATNEPEFDATDAAGALAKENNLDLSKVKGSGADGRITKADVEKALAS
jgi:pyruvate/2-oxoglutarate dehydrogenase complex dihydrolipoamide acyltransferase (E2) component